MFTIESCQPDIWRSDNIIVCAVNCLNTLLLWIKIGKCPHFTTPEVNLFHGKLDKQKLYKLKEVITQIKKTQYVVHLPDKDGHARYSIVTKHQNTGRQHNQLKILREILCCIPQVVSFKMSNLMSANRQRNINEAVEVITDHLRLLHSTLNSGSSLERKAARQLLPHLCGTLASTLASCCITLQLPVTQFVINLYKLSFTSDIMSTKLKFASMLYCSGQCAAAPQVLNQCEGLLGLDVAHYCICSDRPWNSVDQSDAYLENGLGGNIVDLMK